ncbi:hypothetical protein, partial [Sinorhizobium meliloti]
FSPGHRDLHRIFANPTESQLAGITQFFLRQPLSYEWSIFDDLRRAAMVVPAPVLLGPKEEEIFTIQRAKMN